MRVARAGVTALVFSHVVFETDDRLMGVITVVTVSNGHSSVMYVERVYKNSVKPIFSKGRQRPDNCEQVQVMLFTPPTQEARTAPNGGVRAAYSRERASHAIAR